MATDSSSSPSALRTYVNDMAGLQKHILEAVEHQIADERVENSPQAAALLVEVKGVLTQQVADLNAHVTRLGSETGATIKQAITGALGSLAGLYDKVRKDPVSRMLRDDYTALNMSSISYTMLHTTALAFHDEGVASLALSHLKELTPIIMKYNQVTPSLVVAELTDEKESVDTSVADQAVANTQAAWKP